MFTENELTERTFAIFFSFAEIVSMLEQCDQEIFNGYENFKVSVV